MVPPTSTDSGNTPSLEFEVATAQSQPPTPSTNTLPLAFSQRLNLNGKNAGKRDLAMLNARETLLHWACDTLLH